MRGFDAIRTTGGKSFEVESLGARDILLNEGMADDLDAAAGDELSVIAPTGEHRFTVAAVVMGVGLAGTRGDGTNSAVGLVRLETMQELLDRQGTGQSYRDIAHRRFAPERRSVRRTWPTTCNWSSLTTRSLKSYLQL